MAGGEFEVSSGRLHVRKSAIFDIRVVVLFPRGLRRDFFDPCFDIGKHRSACVIDSQSFLFRPCRTTLVTCLRSFWGKLPTDP